MIWDENLEVKNTTYNFYTHTKTHPNLQLLHTHPYNLQILHKTYKVILTSSTYTHGFAWATVTDDDDNTAIRWWRCYDGDNDDDDGGDDDNGAIRWNTGNRLARSPQDYFHSAI